MILYKNGKTIDTNETTRREPNKEEIKEILENLDDCELLRIWNEFDQYSTIYTSEEFDEICGGMTPSEIALKCFYGKHFNPNDEFFTFNGYENFESSDDLADFIDFDDLADYCIRNDEDFDDQEIRDILDADDTED